MVRARVTGPRAIAACLGALVKGLRMVIVAGRFVIRGETGVQCQRHRETEDRDTKGSHRKIPPLSVKTRPPPLLHVLFRLTECRRETFPFPLPYQLLPFI